MRLGIMPDANRRGVWQTKTPSCVTHVSGLFCYLCFRPLMPTLTIKRLCKDATLLKKYYLRNINRYTVYRELRKVKRKFLLLVV